MNCRRVDQDNIDIACQLQMLKSVVKQKNVDRLLRLNASPFHVTIWSNSENNSVANPFFHHFYFIAAPARATIAAAENRYMLSFRQKSLRQPKYHWRFSRASDRQVPDAYDRRIQTFRGIDSLGVQPRV